MLAETTSCVRVEDHIFGAKGTADATFLTPVLKNSMAVPFFRSLGLLARGFAWFTPLCALFRAYTVLSFFAGHCPTSFSFAIPPYLLRGAVVD